MTEADIKEKYKVIITVLLFFAVALYADVLLIKTSKTKRKGIGEVFIC